MKRKHRIAIVLLGSIIPLGFVLWNLTTGSPKNFNYLRGLEGDILNGKYIFNISGCANCHTTLNGKNELELGGGRAFDTEYGVFYAPNISTSKLYGIGNWALNDFANAMKRGVNPRNKHYYPIFPYTSYRLITDKDIFDLWTFWQTLPATETRSRQHKLKFPFYFRAGLSVWKFFNFDYDWVRSETRPRGRYLVEVLGHCAECHTPRGVYGGFIKNRWLQGAFSPDEKVNIPGITSKKLKWTEEQITEYLSTGFTPEFNVVGGKMARVIENTSRLTVRDLEAIARYLHEISNQRID